MLIDATLTWLANLPFWQGYSDWQTIIQNVLHCAGQILNQRQPLVWLPFYCAVATGCPSEQAIPIAGAWLLLYIAAGLFDAVEDQHFESDDWPGLSQAEAINIAGAFLAAIPLVLAELEETQLCTDLKIDFQRTALEMARGQHADLSGWIGSGEGSVERYWQVATTKSGALFALACWAGARLGNPPFKILTAYRDFGYILGQLVQVCDDYKDTYESDDLSDFRINQASLPIVYGRAVARPQERKQIEDMRSRVLTDTQALSQLRQLLDDLGAKHYLLLQIELLRQQAEEALQRTLVTGPSLHRLLALIPCPKSGQRPSGYPSHPTK